jgi:capsular exopolysaccharide synthesis family protein
MDDFKFDIDMQCVLRVLLKYWGILLVCTALGGLLGWGLSKWVFKPVYESSITIFAWETNDDPRATNAIKYQDIEINSRLVNDYKEIITSRKVRNQVSTRINEKFGTGHGDYKISSDLQRNTRILKITALASTPEQAQFAATAAAEVFTQVVQEIMKMKNIQIVDVAELPNQKVSPKTGVNTAIFLLLGFALAFAVCLLRELLDATIKVPEEIQERLNKNVIGTIPNSPHPENIAQKSCGNKIMRSVRIFMNESDNSAVKESINILRTNIEFTVPGKSKSKVIMFTSALPGEGKSTIISNLALSVADSGKKVAILDCDLRKPFLHKFFSVDNGKGLVSVLAGAAELSEIVHANIMGKTLDLYSSGPIPPNPTELLMSGKFKELLDSLAENHDYIFIDAPPILNMADTGIIGHLADATMLIITAGKTRIELIKRCIRQLTQINIDINGILLNRFDIEAIKYNYYYNYHYKYHYYSNYGGNDKNLPPGSETKQS